MDTPRGPLDGIRIIEFVGIGPAPFAAMQFADLGADMVRITRPGAVPLVPDPITGRGRPTIEVDLKDPDEIARIAELVAHADALLEGFRPGVMERLGLGPEPLLARNPKLVYGRMTGWGQTGPLASVAGHDINYIAITGALAAIGPAERPVPPLNLVGDFGGGAMFLVSGMLAALISAGRTGVGQVVDAAMCDGAVSLMTMFHEMAASGDWIIEREANLIDGGAPFYRTYECADGAFIAVGAIEPQFYAKLAEAIGLTPDEAMLRMEKKNWPTLIARIGEILRTRPAAEWVTLMEKTDACVSPVLSLADAPAHPHLAARGAFVEVDGKRQPAPVPRFSATPTEARPKPAGVLTLGDALARWA
ncbi:MAG TPA: CaiB/BaiF CoA-transferase family protein [Rhizobiaceae bacterium]|nr:CaiB/BaiF CoA-transferase family protein [Rhizobiaceae bacterium]